MSIASEQVLVGMASIPERIGSMERAVASLAPQADRINVSLNGYDAIPRFLATHPNVVATLKAEGVNKGDGEKFAAVDDWDGYVLTCDDDLLYPPDYAETMIAGITKHGRGTAVGLHGGTTLGWNGSAVAASHKRVRCLGPLAEDDTDINVLGTGVMAYHAGTVPVWHDVFRHANMADVQMACHGRTMGVPFVCLAHEEGWLQDICPLDGRRIYRSNRLKDGTACDTRAMRAQEIRRFDWTTSPPPRPHARVSIATCGRPEKLLELLHDLDREGIWVTLDVAVYEDPTDADYASAIRFCRQRGWRWHRFATHLGRLGFWRLVDRQFRDAKHSAADWYLFLPDDVRLVRHAIPRAIATWYRLDNPATLTLWRLHALEGKTNWTGRPPVAHDEATEIFHVDGLYLCRRPTLETFQFRCPPASSPFLKSSGVGRKMSIQLNAAGMRMYRVDASLALNNDDGTSIMNPSERKLHPTVTL